jgi:SAM-dependent methyltransferase
MDRVAEILKFISKADKGIEIAPWFAPIAPKQSGYNCIVLDLWDADELRARAATDPNIPETASALIEAVDLVGSAVEIAALAGPNGGLGSFDYIISSHNFEHLPNPIRFLQGCQDVLKPGGVLSMAIPDLRACFDHFRPQTVLAEWLDAYFETRERPSLAQIFAQRSYSAALKNPPGRETAFFIHDNPAEILPDQQLREAFADWQAAQTSGTAGYTDTHCSAFTMGSFELLISECRFLGLIGFEIKEITGLNGCEFFVHLENRLKFQANEQSTAQFYRRRAELFQQVANERARSSAWGWSVLHKTKNATDEPGYGAAENAATQSTDEQRRLHTIEQNLAGMTQRLDMIQSSIIWRIGVVLCGNKFVIGCTRALRKLKSSIKAI